MLRIRRSAVVLDLFQSGKLIGSVIRCAGGVAYAYLPDGQALGTFADLDAAAAALAIHARRDVEAVAA